MCLECLRGFHDECDSSPCCCPSIDPAMEDQQSTGTTERLSKRTRRDNVSVSAGRKRAAADYEIDPNLPCDWRGKLNCGGGFKPIPGCINGYQTDRHHGPDKNTTNNSDENIHLICKPCHNLWHRRNDPLYGEDKCPEGIQLPEPRWATEEEFPILATKEG